MKYSEILVDVLAGKWVRFFKNGDQWLRMSLNGEWYNERGLIFEIPRESYSVVKSNFIPLI